MPLRDHFRPPTDDVVSWESFHAQWPAVIVQQLILRLPARYVAVPRAHLGSRVEVDIAAFDSDALADSWSPGPEGADGGVATAVWAPARPTLSLETGPPEEDEFGVRVYDTRRGRRLVAAIELVSPANKDRPENRRLFVARCAALLRQRVAVSVVDLVTVRESNLYAELLGLLGRGDPALGEEPPPLYAVTCRWRPLEAAGLFEAWHEALRLGGPLPTLPVWLSEGFAVPLDLEASYEKTCSDLRIP